MPGHGLPSNLAHNAIIAAMDDIRRVGPRAQNVHADDTGSGKAPAHNHPTTDYPTTMWAQR